MKKYLRGKEVAEKIKTQHLEWELPYGDAADSIKTSEMFVD